jgi:hypothetical protein
VELGEHVSSEQPLDHQELLLTDGLFALGEWSHVFAKRAWL